MKEKCWNNRPEMKEGYWTHARQYLPDGRYVYVHEFVKNPMSKECGQPGKDLPPAEGCVGCRYLKEYA